jgi:hypothetical protein
VTRPNTRALRVSKKSFIAILSSTLDAGERRRVKRNGG